MSFDITPLIYIVLMLAVGGIILFLRRKAKGTRASYKISLILLGLLLSTVIFPSGLKSSWVKMINLLMVIIITLELSMRFNSENIIIRNNLKKFSIIIIANIIILGFFAMLLFYVAPLYAIIFAMLMASIEYFLVDELREEGDLANPFIMLFIFSMIYFFGLDAPELSKSFSLLQHLAIGIGTGILMGLLAYKMINPHKIEWVHESGIIAMAIIAYIVSSLMGGSGLLAVMLMGVMYGNSHLRKKRHEKTLPEYIFKPLEILVYLMIGFVVPLVMKISVMWKAALLFFIYIAIRIIVLKIVHKQYSFHNIAILTLGPKGIFYSAILMILTNYSFPGQLIGAMFWILLYSLFVSLIVENVEERKINQIDKMFRILAHLRYGRKRELHKHKIVSQNQTKK